MHPFWARSTGVEGTGHWRSGTPALTHTNTFLSVPFPLTTTSSDFAGAPACARAQAGLADISRVLGAGFSPEKLTFPATVAALASSMAAGADAGAVASSLAVSGALLPPQPARNIAQVIPQLNRTLFISANPSPLSLGRHSRLSRYSTSGSRASTGTQPAQLFRRELEHIAHQQAGVIFLIILETRRRRPGKHPAFAIAPEEARRHGRARGHHFRMHHPPLRPSRFQALLGKQKIRRCSARIVFRIARRMALQARRAF